MNKLEIKCAHCGQKLKMRSGADQGSCPTCSKKSTLGLCFRCNKRNLLTQYDSCYDCDKDKDTAASQATSPTQKTGARPSNGLGDSAAVTRAIEALSSKVEELQGYLVSLEVLDRIEKSDFFLGPESKYVNPSLARGLESLLFDPKKTDGKSEQWVRAWRSIPSGIRNELKAILNKTDELQKQTIARIQQLEDKLDDKLKKLPSGGPGASIGGFLRRENTTGGQETPLDWTQLAEAFSSHNFLAIKSIPQLFNTVSNSLRQQRNAGSLDTNLVRVLEEIDEFFENWQKRHGIERFPVVGEKYDPTCQQIDGKMVETQDSSQKRTIKSVSEFGYVLRPTGGGPPVILQDALVVVWD